MVRFIDFIFESNNIVYFLYSPRFNKLLLHIKKSIPSLSNIVNFLISSESSTNSNITFIDIVDNKNDMLSFLQSSRAIRMYNDNKGDYDSFSDWLNYHHLNKDTKVWKDQRSEIKVGKFIRKVYEMNKVSISDKEVEDFVNGYKSIIDMRNDESSFELVSGEIIKNYYLEDNYSDKKGQLGSSCMRYYSCQSYFSIYTENPSVVSLLVLKDEKGKLKGRSLVWKTLNDQIMMDRIYTLNDSDIMLFKNYGKKRNWNIKDDMHYGDINIQKVKLDNWMFEKYPYLDTFVCLNIKEGVLYADESNWPSDDFRKLQETNGTFVEGNVVWSEFHEDYIDADEAVYCEDINSHVLEDEAIYLEYKGIYVSPRSDVVYSDIEGESYLLDDTYYSEYLNDYIYSNNAICVNINSRGDEDFIHDDFKNILVDVEYDGEMVKAFIKDVIFNPLDSKYYFKDKMIFVPGGINYNDNEINIIEYIKETTKSTTEEKLKKYILNSNFSIKDYRQKFTSALNSTKSYNFSKIKQYPLNEIDSIIKLMVISAPSRESAKKMEDNNKLDASVFKDLTLIGDGKLVSSSTFTRITIDSQLLYACILLSDYFIYDILKDPVMLSTWIKLKL